jgi:hypothetical protein
MGKREARRKVQTQKMTMEERWRRLHRRYLLGASRIASSQTTTNTWLHRLLANNRVLR